MSVKVSSALGVTVALIFVLASWGGAAAQGSGSSPLPEPRQERSNAADAAGTPDISFIDSPSATCYRSGLHSDTCYVNWYSLYVATVSSQYMISMTLTIDGQIRANYQGFFQSAINVSPLSHGDGFQVPCGPIGVDGMPNMGHVYSWTLKARDTAGFKAANYGSVVCPASTLVRSFLPLVQRR
jgi:hypothetical protein